MRLGVNLGFLTGPRDHDEHTEVAQAAEALGFDAVWVAEAYGSDAPTVLAWLAANTSTIGLGAGVLQIPARSPAMTAMTAASLDVLSHGRFRLGLGVSGPQVSEGWHGEPFAKPLARTREYVDIVRSALRRDVVSHDGDRYVLPLPGGEGKPLKLSLRGHRTELPIYLAAVGPRNLALAGEVADGWLGIFCDVESVGDQVAAVTSAHTASGRGTPFDAAVSVPAVSGPDPRACADEVRGYAALYVGGMGSREHNFYNAQARRMGFDDAATTVQDAYLDGRLREAMAALPYEFLDRVSLIGPPERIAEQLRRYADAGVTSLNATMVVPGADRRIEVLNDLHRAAELAGVLE